MKDLKHIKRFNETQKNLNISDVSETKKKRKVRKVEPYTQEWEREANILARNRVNIRPCRDCGHPIVDGYRCGTCESTNP